MAKLMMTAKDVMEELCISESSAYILIRKFNEDLQKKGFTVIRGKVSRKYFEEQFYGMAEYNRQGA